MEANGTGVPDGETVTNVDAVGCTPVTLRTTAETPEAGTPPRPSTATSIAWPGPTGADVTPVPSRVSSTRAGGSGW